MSAVANVPLHHVVEGDGPWITLAHSLASDLSLLEEQARVLARQFRVLRFDIRGHGRSPAPPPPYAMQGLADDVQALLNTLGVTQTMWLGVSLGGMIGMTHAIRHPGVITRLIVADTTSGYPPAAHSGWRERIGIVGERGTSAVVNGTLARWFTADFRERQPAAMARFSSMIAATPSAGFIGCAEAIIGYDISAQLGQIACPTLVMVGEEDQATTPAMARAVAERIPGATYEPIPSAAHQSNIEQPAIFNAHLEKFLAHAS